MNLAFSIPAETSRPQVQRLRRGVLAGVLVFIAWAVAIPSMIAQPLPKPGEYQVKAVYLYNFGRFIEWPPSTAQYGSFTICVLGRDPFGTALDATIAEEVIKNQKLVAKRITAARDGVGCQILFISSSEATHMRDILASVEKSGVLTVSDLPGFISSGGMIQFVLMENKVRFEVNLTTAERAGLTFSSQLLKVATEVRRDAPQQGAKQ